MSTVPTRLDVKKDAGITIHWPDGRTSFFSVVQLRRMSPSADVKQLREEIARNPLAVLPAGPSSSLAREALTIIDAELAGNYAIKLHFSDGHRTGVYSWAYLRSMDPTLDGGADERS